MRQTSNDQLVRTILENRTSVLSVAAVELALGSRGRLAKAWPQFALASWNQDEHQHIGLPHERKGDLFPGTPALTFSPTGNLTDAEIKARPNQASGQQTYPLHAKLQHLSARYYRFDFADKDVRTIAFVNPYVNYQKVPIPLASVYALIRRGRTWSTENWTNRPTTGFCQQSPAEHVDELVLVPRERYARWTGIGSPSWRRSQRHKYRLSKVGITLPR